MSENTVLELRDADRESSATRKFTRAVSLPRRLLRAGFLAVALLAGTRGLLLAHAMLRSSEPAAGSVLAGSPPRIRLVFSEAVDASVSGIRLVGASMPPRDLVVAGDPRNRDALIASVDSLSAGEYQVIWRTVSIDGHRVDGRFVFTVRGDTAKPSTVAPATLPLAMTDSLVPEPTLVGAPAVAAPLRGLALGFLMAFAGLLFFSRRSLVNSVRASSLAPWLGWTALILLAAHFVAWTANTAPAHRLDLSWMRSMAATASGHMELVRLFATAVAVAALGVARRTTLALAFSTIALLASGAIGHPAAIHAAVAVPAKAMHLCAAAIWLGGLVWLIVADRADPERYALEARRVSGAALWSLVVVVLSGVAQMVVFLQSPSDVVATTYGKIILLKIAGVVILAAFGAVHRSRHLGRLADGASGTTLRDWVRLEIGVFMIVVLLGGLLAYVSPTALT